MRLNNLYFTLFIIFLTKITGYYISSYPFILGTYNLKSTNDPLLINKFCYLVINSDDTVKFRTITQNGMIANKISKSGTLKFIKNNKKKFFDKNNYDNDITMSLKYNNINKYSYSFLGIEIPEFRYEQIIDYKEEKKIKILQKNNLLYVSDNDNTYYYLFDNGNTNTKPTLPYKEITLTNLIITQIFGFLLNFLLLHLINN